MYTAVVELDTLSDTVGSAAKDHYLRAVSAYLVIVLSDVGAVVVRAVFCSAYMHGIPVFRNADCFTAVSDIVFGNLQDLRKILI